MKFNDLVTLSKKDARDNDNIEALKERYLDLVDQQKESIKSLKGVFENKFNKELQTILDMNQEIKHHVEDGVVRIRFGDGNISLEVRNETHNGGIFSVKKKITMKRGDKTDFKIIELAPLFPNGFNLTIPDSFVAPISQGVNLSITQIQDLKYEINLIEKNIEVFSTVPKLIYYVYKTSKVGNGKANENESLELMLDRAIETTDLFK